MSANISDNLKNLNKVDSMLYKITGGNYTRLTLMVVGQSGLGKTTLINSMFFTPQILKKTIDIEAKEVLLKEFGMNILLTVIDTPGIDNAIDNTNCWVPITEYIEEKYENYWNFDTKINRKSLQDQRVHCCIYFIDPSGHGLKQLDIEVMKKLDGKVNLIPIIAKADTLTGQERNLLKERIINDLNTNKIKNYKIPNPWGYQNIIYAVIGSNSLLEVDGKIIRARKYPWGIVDIENPQYSDFTALRNILIQKYLDDLISVTNSVYYENYRYRKLAKLMSSSKLQKEKEWEYTITKKVKNVENKMVEFAPINSSF